MSNSAPEPAALTMDKPFPALTPAERYHFDVFGYVVIENVLSPAEVAQLREVVYRLRDECLAQDCLKRHGPKVNYAWIEKYHEKHDFLLNIVGADPIISAYMTHPRLVGMAEEIIGAQARIVEGNAHINSRRPGELPTPPAAWGLHRGIDIPFGTHVRQGLQHCSFVKTLTTLVDLGPDDGGTVCIPGSHKIDLPADEIIAAAAKDPRLVHQMVAPAGSTMLFSETLIHGTGIVRSSNERCIIICGYATRMFLEWDDGDGNYGADFHRAVPEPMRILFNGYRHWTRGTRYRRLNDARDERQFELGTWNERAVVPYDRLASTV
ncbi:MAG TPA: phytanoyl-CoA dioxygenase family protein [Polyangiaceae bacterium]